SSVGLAISPLMRGWGKAGCEARLCGSAFRMQLPFGLFLYMKAVNSVDGYVCQEKERASFAGYRLGVRCRLASVEDSDLNQTKGAGEGEMTEPVTMLGTTQPMTVMRPSSGSNAPPPMGRQPSYHPTRWPQVNRLLDLADTLTGGHAKWVQRTFNYLL